MCIRDRDNTPTHSYMKALYKYPFAKPFPYEELVSENSRRGYNDKEFEIYDIDGLFAKTNGSGEVIDTPYFDVFFEMAKDEKNPDELNFRITVYNRSKLETGELYVMPQIFFRNIWDFNPTCHKPHLERATDLENLINVTTEKFGTNQIIFQPSPDPTTSALTSDSKKDDIDPYLLFTENEPNLKKLFGNDQKNPAPYCKDAFEEFIVHKNMENTVNDKNKGTKACAVYHFKEIPPGQYVTVRYKFTNDSRNTIARSGNLSVFDEDQFDTVFDNRKEEADNFYWRINPTTSDGELQNIQRQAFASLLWSKQFYNLTFDEWYKGCLLYTSRCV